MNEEEKLDLGKRVKESREVHQKYKDKLFRLSFNKISPIEHNFLADLLDAYIQSNSKIRMERFAENYQTTFSEVEKRLEEFGLFLED